MDSSSRDILSNQAIDMEDTWFELSPNQKHVYQHISRMYEGIRQDYHAFHADLWNEIGSLPSKLPDRYIESSKKLAST